MSQGQPGEARSSVATPRRQLSRVCRRCFCAASAENTACLPACLCSHECSKPPNLGNWCCTLQSWRTCCRASPVLFLSFHVAASLWTKP